MSFPSIKRRAKNAAKGIAGQVVRQWGPQQRNLEPSVWGMEVDENNCLAWGGVALSDIAETWGSPLHVVSADRLAANTVAFFSRPEGVTSPCEVYYSYKTNPIPGVLSFLHAQGIGAEVISPFELDLALRLGVEPSRIIYNGPAKSDDSLRQAMRASLRLINANSREEIGRLDSIARETGTKPSIGIRVSTGGGWSWQFGLPIETGEARAAFEDALVHESLCVTGLHAHRGVEIRTREDADGFVDSILDFVDVLYECLGLEICILDLGGSLACPSVRPLSARERRMNSALSVPLLPPDIDDCLSIADYTKRVLGRVHERYQENGRSMPAVALEPGRSLTGNAQVLLCSVLNIKNAVSGPAFAVLDAGINLAECVRNEFHQIWPVQWSQDQQSWELYRLVGPICTPGDVLVNAWPLPRLKAGDVLAIMDAGAYFVPFSTAFSFGRAGVMMIRDGKIEALRAAETFEDMTSLDNPSAFP